jgi:5-methyltetrahydropteroyltriglutamate--homocysteine methyltransferase
VKRSTDRILTTHAGALPMPRELRETLIAKDEGKPYDAAKLEEQIQGAVDEVVRRQFESAVDIITDGEESKRSFHIYMRQRLSGLAPRKYQPGERSTMTYGADLAAFPEYFAERGNRAGDSSCVGPISYTGQQQVQADIRRFKQALQGKPQPVDAYLPSIAPGTIEHWLNNQYYPNDEAFLTAIADAMHEEYKAITDAGFIVQVDDPDLADAPQIHTDFTLSEYRRFAGLRVDALNHALRDIPPERVRFHVCWGSYHGPHKFDVPLRDIVDLIFRVKAEAYSIEASNPRHEHEWQVFEDVKLGQGKILIPGVVGHATDFIEHPRLIADRIIRYADLVGRENVIAGTDCGLGPRVGHPTICWAKFEAMAEGARLATAELWGRPVTAAAG